MNVIERYNNNVVVRFKKLLRKEKPQTLEDLLFLAIQNGFEVSIEQEKSEVKNNTFVFDESFICRKI
jgi:hypothetical protein